MSYHDDKNNLERRDTLLDKRYLIHNKAGGKLYSHACSLPIIDYHCHLSPKEIYEDREFDNVGQIMLGGDHYKWRVMRAAGIDERLVTGDAPWDEKFRAYARSLELAGGNPVPQWTKLELDAYFDIDADLGGGNAEEIWSRSNSVIKSRHLSPRKMIEMSNVEYVCTTDDPSDNLEYHEKIAADGSFKTRVAPGFRTDKALNLTGPGYPEYLEKLGAAAGIKIENIDDFKQALKLRMDCFVSHGCRFSDVGLESFPDRIADEHEAWDAFEEAAGGNCPGVEEYRGFLGYMYLFLAKEYAKRDMVMQWHMAVKRNANTVLYKTVGADAGGDCIGAPIAPNNIIRILDAANSSGRLPRTILYTLEPGMTAMLSGIAGSFPGVRLGAAWWFCDHRRGIRELCSVMAETGYIGGFLGMLTDSRSFMSYPRHDFFRRIFCDLVGEWVENGEYPMEYAEKLVRAVAHDNIAGIIK